MKPKAIEKLIALLAVLIRSRCRTKAEADRLMQMLEEFKEEIRTDMTADCWNAMTVGRTGKPNAVQR